jgi:hypothetical protein
MAFAAGDRFDQRRTAGFPHTQKAGCKRGFSRLFLSCAVVGSAEVGLCRQTRRKRRLPVLVFLSRDATRRGNHLRPRQNVDGSAGE